jgi:hypothetical protein
MSSHFKRVKAINHPPSSTNTTSHAPETPKSPFKKATAALGRVVGTVVRAVTKGASSIAIGLVDLIGLRLDELDLILEEGARKKRKFPVVR